MTCDECGANGGHLLGCSRSEYSKPVEPVLAALVAQDEAAEQTAEASEHRRLIAFPLAYLLMWLVSATSVGRIVLRTFFGMWLHELGHASAAWLTGRCALPLPWITFSFDRSWLVSLLLVGGSIALARFGWVRRSWATVGLSATLLVATLVGHLLPASAQRTFDVFGGEAGAMVYGALLSCGFLVRSRLRPFRGGLRWGWLVIGAASWADATRVWWTAKTDFDAIPFGEEDGLRSDASRLVDEHGWDAGVMVKRFLFVALVTLIAAALAWVAAIVRERLAERNVAAR